MTSGERKQAVLALRSVLDAILAAGGNVSGQSGANVRRLVGALAGAAQDKVELGSFGSDLGACFRAASDAGATFDGMRAVWFTASAHTGQSWVLDRVVQTSIRFALVEMSRISSQSTFTSRNEVETVLARLNASFEPAENFAAEQRNNVVWRALVSLHAAVVRDLTRRAKQLPKVVSFDFGARMPALALANRLYGDGGRAEELVAENDVVHPLFSPASGRALAL